MRSGFSHLARSRCRGGFCIRLQAIKRWNFYIRRWTDKRRNRAPPNITEGRNSGQWAPTDFLGSGRSLTFENMTPRVAPRICSFTVPILSSSGDFSPCFWGILFFSLLLLRCIYCSTKTSRQSEIQEINYFLVFFFLFCFGTKNWCIIHSSQQTTQR